jgi:hypothetical protein
METKYLINITEKETKSAAFDEAAAVKEGLGRD